jgi:hypothetical protein
MKGDAATHHAAASALYAAIRAPVEYCAGIERAIARRPGYGVMNSARRPDDVRADRHHEGIEAPRGTGVSSNSQRAALGPAQASARSMTGGGPKWDFGESGHGFAQLYSEEVDEGIWLISFMHYDLGYFDLEQRTLQPLDNLFGTRLSPMS